MGMDHFDHYLDDTAKGTEIDLSDVGSLIVLAVLGCDGNYTVAIEALDRASEKLRDSPIVKEATECFSGAIHHLEVADEFSPGNSIM